MGLFGRRHEKDELYTGDAPVVGPGFDGMVPQAYTGAAGSRPSRDQPAADGSATHGTASGAGPRARARRSRTRRRPSARRGLVLPAILMLAAIGFAAAIILRVAGSVRSNDVLSPPPGPAPVAAAIGTPVTVKYGKATLSIVIRQPLAQPGDGWLLAREGDDPTLLFETDITRIDSSRTAEPLIVSDWSISPADGGDPVVATIASGYRPVLATQLLTSGAHAHGFITFATSATTGSLTLRTPSRPDPIVFWQFAAVTPRVVAGMLGEPTRGLVSGPQFTVTVDNPRLIGPTDDRVEVKPSSGHYLLLDLTVIGIDRDSSGLLHRNLFVFTPSGGQALSPAFPAISDGLFLLSVDGTDPEATTVVFDTGVRAGVLELRDGAGRAVIRWVVPGE